jgi:acyl carrier protein
MSRKEIFLKLEEILKELLSAEVEITEETALVGEKILDSLEFMSYVTTVEEEFGVKLSDDDIENKQLGVMKNMIDFLSK